MRFMAFKLEADEFSNRKHWPSLIKNKFSFVEIFFIHISLWKRVKKIIYCYSLPAVWQTAIAKSPAVETSSS